MAMVSIEQKDEKIMELTDELADLRKKGGPKHMHPDTVVLEENLATARGLIEKLEVRIDDLIKENDVLQNKLIKNVVAARSQSAERIKAKEN